VKTIKDQLSDIIGKKEEADTKIEEYMVGVTLVF